MAYLARSDIDALIPSHVLLQVLDEDADGVEDTGVFDAIANAASNKVDALLQQSSGALDTPYGQIAVRAAICFACHMIYQRKGNLGDERNPFESERKDYERRLEKIAEGAGTTTSAPADANYAGNVDQGGVDDSNMHFWDETGI